RRALPGIPVELDAHALGQDPWEVAEDPAPGHVRERLHVGAGTQLSNLARVEPVRGEQEIGVEVILAEHLTHEREPVRMQARGGETEHDVAGPAARAVDQVCSTHEPDAGAREIELPFSIDPGKLGGLAPENGASGLAA